MRNFFDSITRAAVRFRYVTLAIAVTIIVLGTFAGLELKQELLPPIEFPQTFILAQASGMTSEELLVVVTKRIEAELAKIPELVNIESTTTSAFGALINVSNDFGLNQARLREQIQQAIDRVWFPTRRIQPPQGTNPQAFAQERLAELTPEVMLYLANRRETFLFELSPKIWRVLSDETLDAMLGFLATRTANEQAVQSNLERMVRQEIVPQLQALQQVASVTVSGGQELPNTQANTGKSTAARAEARSFLLQLAPDVWKVIQERKGVGALDQQAVETFKANAFTVPKTVPPLPEGWRMDRFKDAKDLLEMQGGTRTVSDVLNNFYETGVIVGALGQTDDLTPEEVQRMLAIAPSLVEYFDAKHLVAMPPEVFAVLPDAFIDNLDGLTRDALAAAQLAKDLTGETAVRRAEDLPSAWRVQPPRIITFSLASIPLATFSVFSKETVETVEEMVTTADASSPVSNNAEAVSTSDAPKPPEGPALPTLYTLLGRLFGAELDTADDLLLIQLEGDFASTLGFSQLRAADFFNLLVQFSNFGAGAGIGGGAVPQVNFLEFVPAITECAGFNAVAQINPASPDIAPIVFACLTPDVFAYLVANDSAFLNNLNAAVFDYLTPEVLALEGVSPPLADVWATLASQPQFAQAPLRNADDLIRLGGGKGSNALNAINALVPARFAGYEIRLFDSITPTMLRYLVTQEADFYANLAPEVLLKFSQLTLASVPQSVLSSLPEATQAQVAAIISGEQPSAAVALADLYRQDEDVIPTDPNAPALTSEWQFIAQFVQGVDRFDNASDLLRFPKVIGSPAQFINELFEGQGASLAPGLARGLSLEAFTYIAERDPNFIAQLSPKALQNLRPEVFDTLPQPIKDKATAGDVFVPTRYISRTNGAEALLVTITKDAEANTVESFYAVKALIDEIDAANDNIDVIVAFEQSSFIESSIQGVVREGTLGAFFAILIILVFLSAGDWRRSGRRIVGAIVLALGLALLAIVMQPHWEGDIIAAWNNADVILRLIGIGGVLVGIAIAFLPVKLPYPAWRSTLVIAVSIPLSIFTALTLMRWLPPTVGVALASLAETTPFFGFFSKLVPTNITLNIMTLSGLTVAVGRIVDDSIVVLENIYRQLQTAGTSKEEKKRAIFAGVRDVSLAIFSATSITVVVFLPLGLTGGLISEFFLPFGLAVTYSLLASYFVAITVIPVLAYWVIKPDPTQIEEVDNDFIHRVYVPVLRWALSRTWTRYAVVGLAVLSAGIGAWLFTLRPAAFLPDFGEPQISISLELPQGTSMLQTNETTLLIEDRIRAIIPAEELATIRTIVGGGGLNISALTGGGSISENVADVTVNLTVLDNLETYALALREDLVARIGVDYVSVSAATLTSQGGFGGFELVLSGDDQQVLERYDACVILALSGVEGITNVTSNLADTGLSQSVCPQATYTLTLASNQEQSYKQTLVGSLRQALHPERFIVNAKLKDKELRLTIGHLEAEALAKALPVIEDFLAKQTEVISVVREAEQTPAASTGGAGASLYARVNLRPALNYTAEVETQDTINLTGRAIQAVQEQLTLPEGITLGQGFDSQFQTEGFANIFVAMGISIVIVVVVMIVLFASPVYWIAIIFSIVVAPVGAAVALTLTNRVLGISALIGLLMLLGLVVTNAIVLIDRIGSNRAERGMPLYDAVIEGGSRRLRPILMTALSTIIALMPLATGLSRGAIIAEELGTVVIGGIFSSTVLTLVVVPVVYYLITPLHKLLTRSQKN